jgi:hypothetical protein
MDAEPEEVSLRSAYTFDCPACGREQIAHALSVNNLDEVIGELPGGTTIEELREMWEVEIGEEGCFMLTPESVTCRDCKLVFPVSHADDW